jgi:hypothetical protein
MRDREVFDSDREFVVIRRIRVGGTDFTPGQEFPKQLCNARRLRQLFEISVIKMSAPREPSYRSPTARFDAMTLEELRDWLTSHGQVPRATWDRGKLLEEATVVGG